MKKCIWIILIFLTRIGSIVQCFGNVAWSCVYRELGYSEGVGGASGTVYWCWGSDCLWHGVCHQLHEHTSACRKGKLSLTREQLGRHVCMKTINLVHFQYLRKAIHLSSKSKLVCFQTVCEMYAAQSLRQQCENVIGDCSRRTVQ